MEETKSSRGGARPGAGRKAKEVTETTGFRVHKESLDFLRSIDYPLNAEVNKLIKRLAKKLQKEN